MPLNQWCFLPTTPVIFEAPAENSIFMRILKNPLLMTGIPRRSMYAERHRSCYDSYICSFSHAETHFPCSMFESLEAIPSVREDQIRFVGTLLSCYALNVFRIIIIIDFDPEDSTFQNAWRIIWMTSTEVVNVFGRAAQIHSTYSTNTSLFCVLVIMIWLLLFFTERPALFVARPVSNSTDINKGLSHASFLFFFLRACLNLITFIKLLHS